MRIVSHTCSNTEIVCALGCADLLVGVDEHCDHPPAVVGRLPRVGPDLGVDVAAVARLRPDLVLTSLTVPGHEKVVEGLRRAGLPLLVLEPTALADVPRDVLRIARALGVEAAGRHLAGELEAAFVPEPAAARAGALGAPPRLLVEWWPKPVIVPGGRSWVSDMIRLAGGVNPFGDRDVTSTPVADDEVRAAAPDAVVVSWCGVAPEKVRPDVVARRAGWREVPALRAGRIRLVPEAWMGRPGPRLVEGVRALRAIVAECRRPAGGEPPPPPSGGAETRGTGAG